MPGLRVQGEAVDLTGATEVGYALLRRVWRDGEVVALDLPLATQRIYAHPAVAADVGAVALRRGPLVYCLEQIDHDMTIQHVLLPAGAELGARFEPGLLGGVVVLEAEGAALADEGWEDTLRAIPYAVWDNRAPGPMTVWLREQPSLAETSQAAQPRYALIRRTL